MKRLTLERFRQTVLAGILATLPLSYLPHFEVSSATVRISQILGVILILSSINLLWQNRLQLFRSYWIGLVLFNVVSFMSAAFSPFPSHSLKTASFILFVSLLAWTIACVFSKRHLRQYTIWLFVGAVASSCFGLYQFFGDLAGFPGWATGLRPEYMKGGIFPFPRIQSTALEPLYFANYLLVPLALALGLQAKHRRLWPVSMLLLTVIILSLSRGAQVAAAFIVVVVIAGTLVHRRYRQALGILVVAIASTIAALALVALGSYLYPQYNGHRNTAHTSVEKFTGQATNVSQGESAKGRALTRKLAVQAAEENPVLGLGPGNFGHYATRQQPTKFKTADTIVNNETLELAAEQGLLGLLFFGIFIVGCLYQALKARASQEAGVQGATTLLIVGLLAIGLQYQLFSTLYITHIWVAIGGLAGLSKGHDEPSKV